MVVIKCLSCNEVKMKEFKLNFELVPDSCWYSNLRTLLKPSAWDKIRRIAYAKNGGFCAICGAKPKRLEAHEQWSYDETTHVQSLKNIIALCHSCHQVVHIGYTQLKGDEERAIKHFMKVNKCTYADYRRALGQANEEHQRRNKIPEWQLDLNFLEEFLSCPTGDGRVE